MEESSHKVQFSWLRVIAIVFIFILLGYFLLIWLTLDSKERPRQAKCRSNLMQIGLALKQYALDNHDSLPFVYDDLEPYQTFGMLYPAYVSNIDVFRCPSSRDEMWDTDVIDGAPFSKKFSMKNLSYAYGHNMSKPWTEEASSTTRIAGDKYATEDYTNGDSRKRPSNHATDGRNFVRLDGSAKWDNSKGKLEVDPETEYEKSGHPESDQTGTDWWSDPPDKR